ncbi:hypothetical protein GCM10009858_01400 [Terrabacter carboxydivorans]|uniref:Uncharacterized protein n=1 Tax=Terrabacter carboxydivorans TaxID=619730 RepID=A0ABN3KNG4_9MICO
MPPSRLVRPRTHWMTLAAVLVALGLALVVQGYVRHLYSVGDDAAVAQGPAGSVPAALMHGGPVVDARGAPCARPALPTASWPSPSTTVRTRPGRLRCSTCCAGIT